MKSLMVLFKTEMILAIREFSGVLFGVILPAGVMLLFGIIQGDKMAENGSYSMVQQSFAAVITIGICATGLMGIPITLTSYREKKVLKFFKVTPTSPLVLLMAQFFNNFVFAAISSTIVWGIAVVIFDYRMIGSTASFLGAYLLLTFSMYSIGLLIASIAGSVKTANLLCTLVYFPTLFLSGATIPYEIMPKALQSFSNVIPLTQGIKLLKAVSLGESHTATGFPIVLLILTTVICAVISVKTFRYDFE